MEKQSLLAIKQNKLLKNIDSSVLDFSQIKGQLRTLDQGGILYREGYKAESIFLIISGEINVLKKNLYGKTQSLIFNDNDCFGYKEIVDGGIRTSTAVALRDAYVIELTLEELGHLMTQANLIEENIRSVEQEISFINKPAEDKLSEESSNIEHTHDVDVESLNNTGSAQEIIEEIESDSLEKNEIDITADNTEINNIEYSENEGNQKVETEFEELDDFVVEQTGPGEFEIKSQTEDDADHFLLGEPKDHSEISKIAEADDEIPKSTYSGKSKVSQSTQDNLADEENHFLEEDEAFFAGLESDPPAKIHNDAFMPEEKVNDTENTDDDLDIEELRMTDRFSFDEDYPTEIVKEEILEEEYLDNSTMQNTEEVIEQSSGVEEISGFEESSNAEELILDNNTSDDEDFSSENLEENTQAVNSGSNELTSDQLKMINKAAHSVTSNVKIEEVLNNIVKAACELTHADRGTLYLVDKESNELWSKVVTESEVKEIRLNLGEGIAGWVGSSGEVVNITNVDEDQRFKRDYDRSSGYKTKSMLCFPLKNKENEIIGVIQLLNSQYGYFSSKDEQFLDALSAHASAALINAELVEKLLKSERVTSLGKMANFLIQDIKKPVLVSKRYAEHLISKELPKDAKQVLEMMLEQLNHVADIVQTTSSYSEGKTVLRAVSTSLNETLDDYINRADTYLRNKGCSITTQYDLDVNVKIDLKEFFQCFNHLIKNACDSMPDGGSISISTFRKGDSVEIAFKDRGLGIPDTIIEKIFEPFMTHGKKEGTGLGLSITKKIVEDHSGSIIVSSDLGEGTTFTITLPVASSY